VVVAVTLAHSSHGSKPHQAGGVLPALPGSVNVIRFQKFGGSYQCDGDSCGAGGAVSANGFTLPASPTAYASTLSVSFQYRASGKGARFAVAAHVTKSATGHALASTPAQRAVISTSAQAGSATLVFRPAPLSGGVTYTFEVSPKLTHYVTKGKIVVTQVVFNLQAWLP
jgi:hypothetical protein